MGMDDTPAFLSASSSGKGNEDNQLEDAGCGPCKADTRILEVQEGEGNKERSQRSDEIVDRGNHFLPSTVDNSPVLEVGFQLEESVLLNKETCNSHIIHTENGLLSVRDETGLSYNKGDKLLVSSQETCASSLSGFKRSRESNDEQEPSVQIIYKSLTRDSRKKLEELLQQWSQWHAKHCSSENNSESALESGERKYFPALQIGVDKSSSVSFWLDDEVTDGQNKDFISFDGNSVPLYNRGYSLALTATNGSSNLDRIMEIREASRCFNCGSYSHSLRECPQPRDNVAVNNARKQHKSKRNQNPGARNPSRYYQKSVGGKYDGLKPGSLDAETRQMLGLQELDPPPWLNRMREIGYPPGYLDIEEDDQPSGITIFGEEEHMEEKEDGEILENGGSDLPRKMSVEFPGINAPIPEFADEKLWASGTSDMHMSRSRSYGRYNHSADSLGGQGVTHEQRWPLAFGDDEPPPPGCELESPSSSSYSRRYGGYDSSYTANSLQDSPSLEWNSSSRRYSSSSRRNPFGYESSSAHRAYDYLSYSSPR